MSATSQVTDFSDLYTDLQNRVKVATGKTATENQAKRYINIALQDMHIGHAEAMPWSERRAVLLTQPRYTTGTVTISQGSTSLTGSGTAWNTANSFGVNNVRPGGKLLLGSGREVYEVDSVGGDGALELTTRYIGSALSGDSYTYFEDEYDLASDFARPIDLTYFGDGNRIVLIGRTEFRRRYPLNRVTGNPRVGTIVDRVFQSNTTPRRRLRLHHPPQDVELIPYSYATSNLAVASDGTEKESLVDDSDEPIVPFRYRHVIVFHGLYHWYRDKKDDTRSQEAKAEYTDLMLRILGDTEIGESRPQLRPAVAGYRSRAQRPYSGARGRFDVGDRFDRLDDR